MGEDRSGADQASLGSNSRVDRKDTYTHSYNSGSDIVKYLPGLAVTTDVVERILARVIAEIIRDVQSENPGEIRILDEIENRIGCRSIGDIDMLKFYVFLKLWAMVGIRCVKRRLRSLGISDSMIRRIVRDAMRAFVVWTITDTFSSTSPNDEVAKRILEELRRREHGR